MSNRLNAAMAIFLLSTVICGAVAGAGYEGVESLDDAFLALALVFGALFSGFVAITLGRILSHA